MRKYLFFFMLFLTLSLLSADYKENFNIAGKMFKDGFLEEAIRVYNEVIEEARTTQEADEALYKISIIQLNQGKLEIAETTIKRHLSGYPNSRFAAESMLNLGKVQHLLKKNSEAEITLKKVLEAYPKTPSGEESAFVLSSVYLDNGDYNNCIIFSQKLIKDYANTSGIPKLLYNLFKAYLNNNMKTEALNTLAQLSIDYPDSDSRWDATYDRTDYFLTEGKLKEAIQYINDILIRTPPRKFEERFLLKMIEVLEEDNQNKKAYDELLKLLTKYNNSEKLDYYLIKTFRIETDLNKYTELSQEKWTKVFKSSKYLDEYNLLKAEMFYNQNNYEKSEEILKSIPITAEKSVQFHSMEIQANIYENKAQYKAAINNYTVLINEYNEYGKNYQFLYKIGNLFLEKFRMYENALRYFEQAAVSNLESSFGAKIIYKIAECYEKMMKYSEALTELNQINISEINDQSFKQEISAKKRYLQEYKITDYHNAFNTLVVSVDEYLDNNNRQKLKENLAIILAEDLKEYEQALMIIEDLKTTDSIFRKLVIKLQMADKYLREGKQQEANSIIAEVTAETNNSGISQQIEMNSEIMLSIKLIKANNVINIELSDEIYRFVMNYPDSIQRSKFIGLLAEYYSHIDKEKEVTLLKQLYPVGANEDYDYLRNQIRIADYYYEKGEKETALNYYRKAERVITTEQPDVLYRYAESLLQAGFEDEAMNNFAFFINNVSDYRGIDKIIREVVSYYQNNNDNQAALYYLKKMPDNYKNDQYYETISGIYSEIGDKKTAMESLMRIIEKTDNNRYTLAELHHKNGTLQIAVFTLEELVKSTKETTMKSKAKELLCKIYFEDARYKDAVIIAQEMLTMGTSAEYKPDYVTLAKISIISYYRIQNRPKAEENIKSFKKYLENNSEVLAEIELNEAIYYIDIDPKKAESLLTKLNKNQKNNGILSESYFWRGISFLKQKDYIKARSDFETVVNSGNKELINRANLKLGTISFSEEKFNEALDFYYAVIIADSTGKLAADAASNFALVCKTIQEWQKAIKAYELIMERWGDKDLQGETLFDIAFCYYRDKKYSNAISTFNKAIALLKNNELRAEAQYWIGDSYFENEDYVNSISEFLKVSYNYPELTQWAASADLQVGQAYYKVGKIDQAKYIYNKVIEKYGSGSDWGKEAKKRLETLF